MGFVSRTKLDEGINLASMRTPMWRQAMAVHELSKKHADLQAEGRRLFQATTEERRSPDWKTAVERLLAAEADLSNQEHSMTRPRTHDYELQPVER